MGEKVCQICRGEGVIGYTIDGEQPTLEGCPSCCAINVIDRAADVYYDNLRSLTRVLGRVSLEDLSDIFRKAVVPAIEKVRELDRAGMSANPLHGVVDRQCEEIESLRQRVTGLEAALSVIAQGEISLSPQTCLSIPKDLRSWAKSILKQTATAPAAHTPSENASETR